MKYKNAVKLHNEDEIIIKNGYPFVYVLVPSDEFCSEFGAIGVKSGLGGLIRTY